MEKTDKKHNDQISRMKTGISTNTVFVGSYAPPQIRLQRTLQTPKTISKIRAAASEQMIPYLTSSCALPIARPPFADAPDFRGCPIIP